MSNLSEEEKKAKLKSLIEEYEICFKESKYEGNIEEYKSLKETHKLLKDILELIARLQKENEELNLENQALYESINCNDDNMLARRYEKLQKELEQAKSRKQLEIDTAEEVLKWKGKYHLLSRKINGVLEDKIKDKIKELLKEYKDTGYYELERVLEDLLRENNNE